MKTAKWIVLSLPLVGSLALLGCPNKPTEGSDAAPGTPPSSDPAVATQPTAAAPPASTVGKPATTVVLPHLNLDAAVQLLAEAGIPALPTMDAGGGGAIGTTGVPPECDQYAAKQELCIQKMQPAVQPAARGALGAAKGSWPALAATPAGHDALLAQCKNLLAQANACK